MEDISILSQNIDLGIPSSFRTLLTCAGLCLATPSCNFYQWNPGSTICQISTGAKIIAPLSHPMAVYADVTFPGKNIQSWSFFFNVCWIFKLILGKKASFLFLIHFCTFLRHVVFLKATWAVAKQLVVA
jgi:hypothetical protein